MIDHFPLIFFFFSLFILEAIMMDTHLESVSLHSSDCKSTHTLLRLYRPLNKPLADQRFDRAVNTTCVFSLLLLFSSLPVYILSHLSISQLTENDLCPFLSTFYKRDNW